MHKRWKWLSMVFVLLLLLGCSSGPGPSTKVAQGPAPPAQVKTPDAQGVPVAEVVEREFDFGVMKEDATYTHDFKIANKGSGVLEIQKAIPD